MVRLGDWAWWIWVRVNSCVFAVVKAARLAGAIAHHIHPGWEVVRDGGAPRSRPGAEPAPVRS